MKNPTNGSATVLKTAQEGAARLRISLPTFYRRVKEGDFLTPIRIGRRVFFDDAEIEALINKCRAGAA